MALLICIAADITQKAWLKYELLCFAAIITLWQLQVCVLFPYKSKQTQRFMKKSAVRLDYKCTTSAFNVPVQ